MLAQPPVVGPPMIGSGDVGISPVKILLVDDEQKNILALEAVLAAADRDLVQAGSGREALKHLLEDDFAVILLDVHMPGLDGFETAELIRGRERTRDTPIIFLTAADRGETFVSRGYSLGAVDYIVKPFDPDVLRSKVAVFVELCKKSQQVQHQAEQLAETMAFLNSVLESATEYAITAIDLAGRFQAWNEGARQIYGYTAEEMVGKQSIEALHTPADVEAGHIRSLLATAARRGKAEGVFERVRKNGRRFSASVTVNRRMDATGRAVGYVVISKDITQLKRAEEERVQLIEEQAARAEAEAARDRLQQVVDVLPEAIVIADADGHVFMCNGAAREILGRALAADVPAAEAFGMLRLDGSPYSADTLPLARVVSQGEVVRGEQLLIPNAATGKHVPVLANGAPLRDARGEPAGGVMVFQDISAIKDLEREKDAFLAAVSHDLKSPLTTIKARAQILQRRAARLAPPESGPLVEGLQGIDQATTRITAMINELIDVTRLQMGRPLQLDRQPTDLAELAHQVAAECQSATERHTIRVECAQPHVIGEWDPARLERAMTNLVSNAIKYSPTGGDVTLTVRQEREDGRDWAIVQVHDRGIGVPSDDLPRVFERFYRASNVDGAIEGTGVGLAGVNQIVEQHGGYVSVESRENVGSTFTMRLPMSATVINGEATDGPSASIAVSSGGPDGAGGSRPA